jgi:hypothetical protein
MAFLYRWVAPNGVPVVVAKITDASGNTRTAVGVFEDRGSNLNEMESTQTSTGAASGSTGGWGVVDAAHKLPGHATWYAEGASDANPWGNFSGRFDFLKARGDIFYYLSGSPYASGYTIYTHNSAGQNTGVAYPAGTVWDQGWYALDVNNEVNPANVAAYAWGVQQLANMSSGISSAASGLSQATGPTISQSTQPGVALATAVLPVPPPAASRLPLYIGLGVAAVAAGLLLMPSSSSSSSSAS